MSVVKCLFPVQDPSRENLRLREDGSGGVYVEGLSEHVVRSTSEIKRHLREGSHARTTAETRMNKVVFHVIMKIYTGTKQTPAFPSEHNRRVAAAMQYSTSLLSMLCMAARERVLSPLPNSD